MAYIPLLEVGKAVRIVPVVRDMVDELVAIGRVDDNHEGKVLIDTGAQVSLIKVGASAMPLTRPDVILKGIPGKALRIYGRWQIDLELKPGVKIPGNFVVANLPKGFLAVLGFDKHNRRR